LSEGVSAEEDLGLAGVKYPWSAGGSVGAECSPSLSRPECLNTSLRLGAELLWAESVQVVAGWTRTEVGGGR